MFLLHVEFTSVKSGKLYLIASPMYWNALVSPHPVSEVSDGCRNAAPQALKIIEPVSPSTCAEYGHQFKVLSTALLIHQSILISFILFVCHQLSIIQSYLVRKCFYTVLYTTTKFPWLFCAPETALSFTLFVLGMTQRWGEENRRKFKHVRLKALDMHHQNLP